MGVIDIRTEEATPPEGIRYTDSYGNNPKGGIVKLSDCVIVLNDGYATGDNSETCEVKYEDLPNLIKALIKVAEIKGIELDT